MKKYSKAFGLITRNVDKLSPITDFLDNAEKYNHKVDHLIIAYEDDIYPKILKQLEARIKVTLIQRGNASQLKNYLRDIGLSSEEVEIILGTPYREKYDKISYGTSRNHVLIAALKLGVNYLYFFDSDIYPKILTEYHDGSSKFTEIDFIGSHLKYLQKNDVILTTSDYTGYYIIPKMNFPYMMDLLRGVQKEDRFYYISTVDTPVVRDKYLENIFVTQKALGGNLALDLSKKSILPPFFSTNLVVDNECFLGRGEDTLFGPEIHGKGRCLDIDLLIFHNCFGDFPNKPSIFKQKNLDRFFYACMGWLIRNPFLNWIRKEDNIISEEINIEQRYESLIKGSKSASEYFNDKRFLKLPKTFKLSYEKLNENIQNYKDIRNTWDKMYRSIKIGDNL